MSDSSYTGLDVRLSEQCDDGERRSYQVFGVSFPSKETMQRLQYKFERIKALRDKQGRANEAEVDDDSAKLSLEAFGYAEALNDLGHLSAADVIKIGEAFKTVLGAK